MIFVHIYCKARCADCCSRAIQNSIIIFIINPSQILQLHFYRTLIFFSNINWTPGVHNINFGLGIANIMYVRQRLDVANIMYARQRFDIVNIIYVLHSLDVADIKHIFLHLDITNATYILMRIVVSIILHISLIM